MADGAEMVMAKDNRTMNSGKKRGGAVMDPKTKNRVVMMRMLIMALVDILGICILCAMSSDANVEFLFYQNWLIPMTVIFGVLTAASVAYQVVVIVKKIKTETHYVTPAMLICITAFCLAACLLYKRLIPMTIVIASVVATALFIVYCLYVHIFYR